MENEIIARRSVFCLAVLLMTCILPGLMREADRGSLISAQDSYNSCELYNAEKDKLKLTYL
jgi:hypothetical protein